jgi:hypothetical protein
LFREEAAKEQQLRKVDGGCTGREADHIREWTAATRRVGAGMLQVLWKILRHA